MKRYLWYSDLILSTLGTYLGNLLGNKFNPTELPLRVVWRSRDGRHPYTGIFKGANHGIVRLSYIAQPNPLKPVGFNPRPSMGLKFLRDGMDAASLVAMFSLNGQQSWNFFRVAIQ